MRKRAPHLDLGGTDRKILGIANGDLKNYLKVHWKLMGKKTANSKLREKVNQFFHESLEELEEFVDLWTGMWMRKWNERVKLVIGDKKDSHLKNIHGFSGRTKTKWNQMSGRSGMEKMAIEALIRNGEICGTSVLAESLLKPQIGQSVQKKNDLLVVVNDLFRMARQISQSKSPLMFVRIDKTFWNVLRQDNRRKIY